MQIKKSPLGVLESSEGDQINVRKIQTAYNNQLLYVN